MPTATLGTGLAALFMPSPGCCRFASGGGHRCACEHDIHRADPQGRQRRLPGSRASGVCVGLYADAHKVTHGFRYRHRRFTAINDPKASPTPAGGTATFSINDFGAIVGEYGDAHGVSHGFVYRGGKFTTIDDPHASTAPGAGTFAIGINNLGVIDGVYVDSRGLFRSFIDRGGKFTTIDDPHASTAPGAGTFAATINDLGAVTGFYIGAGGASHGFVYRHGVFTTIDDPAAAAGTTRASGINDQGVIVGGYQDKITGNEDGFELSPAR
jgi:hypothetical protein